MKLGHKLAARRPRRGINTVNYKEESSDDEDQSFISVDSNLPDPKTPVSPSHPEYILQPTPPSVNQVLSEASDRLQLVQVVQDIRPIWPALEDQNIATMATPFESENGTDDANALQNACRAMEKLEWDDNDVEFFPEPSIALENPSSRQETAAIVASGAGSEEDED